MRYSLPDNAFKGDTCRFFLVKVCKAAHSEGPGHRIGHADDCIDAAFADCGCQCGLIWLQDKLPFRVEQNVNFKDHLQGPATYVLVPPCQLMIRYRPVYKLLLPPTSFFQGNAVYFCLQRRTRKRTRIFSYIGNPNGP
jgi:hypothetical protein